MSVFLSMGIPVKRMTGQYVKGRWQDNEPELLTVRGTLQPAPASKIENIAGGRRVISAYYVRTPARLQSPDPATGAKADLITINGRDHVLISNDYRNVLMPHTTAVAVVFADDLGGDAGIDPVPVVPEAGDPENG